MYSIVCFFFVFLIRCTGNSVTHMQVWERSRCHVPIQSLDKNRVDMLPYPIRYCTHSPLTCLSLGITPNLYLTAAAHISLHE